MDRKTPNGSYRHHSGEGFLSNTAQGFFSLAPTSPNTTINAAGLVNPIAHFPNATIPDCPEPILGLAKVPLSCIGVPR